ncbi:Questin oxidase [Pseudocercospora fuligena]|uniref:Questin oxidase n=1 Tax=Pseudocercospora fuligena TaxID=685502 RepID=A0A8H6R6R1_9PEZI|nr:Questin oxidase [Pseudocercospora fuligena]
MVLHDHMPHILCSGLDLGQDSALLIETYETVMKTLVKIDHTFARGEKIDGGRLREYFGKRELTVAFVDFFDEEFRKENGDWKKVVERYLYEGERPLMNGLIGGLGHPIIHLAYAYDFECKEIASEGLSLLLTDYSDFHALMDEPQSDNSTYKTTSLAEVLERVYHDSRFDNLTQHPGIVEMEKVMKAQGTAVIEHWNAWQVTDQLQQLEHICDLGTLLALTTFDHEQEFDFFLLHLMTVAHGVRSMWLHIPENKRVDMLREYGLLAISIYVCQQRPPIRSERITDVELGGRDWEWVRKTAREHPAKFDVHFYKAVRAPEEFKGTWGDKDEFYLKAAVRYLDDFRGWTGFGEGIPGFDEKQEGWSARREYSV